MSEEIEKIQQEYQELKEDYLNELGENYKLTELWLKSQQENKQLKEKIDKAIELIKRSAGYKGICTQPETDTFSTLLSILGDKENEKT